MTACSTDDVLRPTVDVGQTTSAIEPALIRPLPGYRPGQRDVVGLAEEEASDLAAEPGPDDELVRTPESEPYLGGTDEPEQALAEPEQILQTPDEPVEEEPVRVAALPRPSIAPLPPSEPYESTYPRLDSPKPVRPRTMSADEVDCRRQLKKLGVRYQDLAPIRDSSACYIDNPVKVSAMGSVQMKPAATLTCRMALTFAKWTRNELVPNARWRYFSGVKTIRQGSSYSCRKIAGSRTQSAHSQGNALDVMAIELNNGKDIDVTKKGFFSFRERKLLNNVRADGCEYFSTVLGPGYNYDHRNHFHFDLMQRKSGRRACH
ncbi:MAG: extensin family protein [Rhizobiaceae bacterium]